MRNSTLSVLEIADLHKRITDCSRDFHELISEIANKAESEKKTQDDSTIINTEYRLLDKKLKDMGFNSETYDCYIVGRILACDIVSQFLEERKLCKS